MGVRAALQRAMTSLRAGETSKNASAEAAAPMRILVVDDDQDVLDAAERLLIGDGYVPILTRAPQAALQMARSMRPGAIFLDVLMPGFDGWDVLAALKSDPETSSIPVLMICMLGERVRAQNAGAAGVIPKPMDMAKVRAALAGAASGHALALRAARA